MFRTPAEAYDRHIGRYGRELARALIAAAGVQPGGRALDVGCGPGALTSELVATTGAEHVAAVDPSVPFAEACRLRLPGVRVEVAPAEALPFADAEFDHAFAQLVVNFMSDPLAGVRAMRRVTRPGGTVVAAVWDYAGEMTLLRRFWDAAISLDPDAADRDEGRCMPLLRARLARRSVAGGRPCRGERRASRRQRGLRRLRGPLAAAGARRGALGRLRRDARAPAAGGPEG